MEDWEVEIERLLAQIGSVNVEDEAEDRIEWMETKNGD